MMLRLGRWWLAGTFVLTAGCGGGSGNGDEGPSAGQSGAGGASTSMADGAAATAGGGGAEIVGSYVGGTGGGALTTDIVARESDAGSVDPDILAARLEGVHPDCRLEVDPGPCDSFVTRYGYVLGPPSGCQAFQYGGCDGNSNNFESFLACHHHCNLDPFCYCASNAPSDCEEDPNCSDCPATMQAGEEHGNPCPRLGLGCNVEGDTCDCILDVSGNLTWWCDVYVDGG